ncbi:MAG: ABC transporter substrate-binding protein, partial [Desulfobacterales bacterium]|nr:ABC transporter substrate-binding protein [Desulfobacterales bacterium]
MAIKKSYIIGIAVIIIVIVAAVSVYYIFYKPEEAEPVPGEFELSGLTISSSKVWEGEFVTISVDVANIGETNVTGPITLSLNDVTEDTEEVTLVPGETKTVTFTVTKSAKKYDVTIPGTTLTGTFTVYPETIYIGAAICLTGPWAGPAADASLGIRDYWTLVNERGGIPVEGLGGINVTLLEADNAYDPDTSLTIVTGWLAEYPLSVLFTCGTHVVAALYPT